MWLEVELGVLTPAGENDKSTPQKTQIFTPERVNKKKQKKVVKFECNYLKRL